MPGKVINDIIRIRYLTFFQLGKQRRDKENMQKKTLDYDNVFKTMKSKHKRLFISVINDIWEELPYGCEGRNFTIGGVFDRK